MWYYAVKDKKTYTKYSSFFESKRKAEEWYMKHGIKLESKFNRKLELLKCR